MATAYAGTKRDQAQYPGYGRLMSSTGCSGEGCGSRNPWPVHHVRYRSNLCRLCTSCVLRNHPGAFCPKCFDLIESSSGRSCHLQPQQWPPAVVHCVSCPSVCHTACLSDAENASSYICPTCANPNGYYYFPLDSISEPDDPSASPNKKILEENPLEDDDQQKRKIFDIESSKILLAAARIASASMQKAVSVARIEAERKAKDAVMAKRKAKEMLEKVLMAAKIEKNQRRSQITISAKIDNENRWLDVQEAIPISQISPVKAITMGEDRSRKQDSPMTNGNRRVVFSGLPEKAGLHS